MANALLAKDPAQTCVLVTGGAGFIGSHTVVELLERGYQVVIVDDLSNSSREAVRRVGKIAGVEPVFADVASEELAEAAATVAGAELIDVTSGPSLTFYEANILDRAALETIFTMHPVDVIIHFAGFKAVGESVAKPLEYYWNNIAGTLVLAEVAREHGCKNIVFSSSATVYGDPEFVPITEACPKHNATNPYGQTKSMLEQILTDLYVGDNEWNVVLLRYFNPIGAHVSGTIGEDPKGIPNNLLPYVAQVAVGKLERVGVFGDDYPTPDGTGVRDYIHVVDLARGHVAALDWMAGRVGTGEPIGLGSLAGEPAEDGSRRGVGIFNLGTGNGSSVLDVIHAFEAACGHEIPYEIMDRRPGDIAECYADASKARDELGWVAEYDMARMCEDGWRWQSQNPDGYGDAE
ncbi:UDP-glucose 4-epimerase GalE [Adlercreutzia sp. R25]|uniref:UDP-glucose 4-epimerase n=1 Tax=Adlercreutzia shanghongiae TaxID=3111773 RepID=A0ABU6IVS7_9ACTN|nr:MULTISPECIES: UDP-glucose 4-epimerase GalE [unclassified Adlercreutzia]MEC4272006.1 UDP-glucose 4-epimerase GalE [Adlercreutzia sp. R25]MEC4293737.1 UDP-glucose 4-epimerase GalE [Adlercreutzia sp. R22]